MVARTKAAGRTSVKVAVRCASSAAGQFEGDSLELSDEVQILVRPRAEPRSHISRRRRLYSRIIREEAAPVYPGFGGNRRLPCLSFDVRSRARAPPHLPHAAPVRDALISEGSCLTGY